MVAGTLAVILQNVVWVSSLPRVLRTRKEKSLGSLNAIPYALMCFSCTGWTTYGYVTRDLFVCFACWPGIVLGYFYSSSALITIANKEEKELQRVGSAVEIILSATAFYWGLLAIIALVGFDSCLESDKWKSRELIGINCVIFNLLYYSSPLSTILEVIKTRDSSSIYRPMVVCNFVNSVLWTIMYASFSGDAEGGN